VDAKTTKSVSKTCVSPQFLNANQLLLAQESSTHSKTPLKPKLVVLLAMDALEPSLAELVELTKFAEKDFAIPNQFAPQELNVLLSL